MKTYISLGSDCHTTGLLKSLRLRVEAYPFDWTISPLRNIIDCIRDDFRGFMDDLRVVNRGVVNTMYDHHEARRNNTKERVDHKVCTRYNIVFLHDFVHEGGPDDDNNVRNKYIRRINRFNQICKQSDSNSNRKDEIVFVLDKEMSPSNRRIYHSTVPDNGDRFETKFNIMDSLIEELKDVIRCKYPSLVFSVIFADDLKKQYR
jgi:hypothetical protein